MRTSALAIVFLITLGVVTDFAQNRSNVGRTGPLRDLSAYGLNTGQGEQCGKYFRYTAPPDGDREHVGLLLLVFSQPEKPNDIVLLPWGTDKFQIRVTEGMKVPTVRILREGGPLYPWAEIIISPEDLKRSPCLSHVQTARGV